nr:zinc finger, CCHC-type [Tanacetum cinerariifolium]
MDGMNFTRWKEKMKFLLTAFEVYYVLERPPVGVMTQEEQRKRKKMSQRVKGTAIGIDLGTTYSCAAIWFCGKKRVEIIPNEHGNRITPSCVAFNDSELLVGESAKNQIARNPTNTVFEQTWETSKKENAVWFHSKIIEKREREARLGEVVVKNGDERYLIPGVYYAPEVTLNVLSLEQLERQGVDIIYEDNTCRLIYMFKNPKDHKFNEDKLRIMHNEYYEKYFESLDHSAEQNKIVGLVPMQDDMIEIKGALYSTKDTFKGKFDKAVKWFYKSYLEKPLPGGLLGLSKQDGEEVKKCYIKYFDVFTSYYKTAMVPNQEYISNLNMPTKIVEEGKEYTCLASHQCDFTEIKAPNMETANRKGKEKIHHFGVKLEDLNEKEYHDSRQLHPIQPNRKEGSTLNKGIKIKTKDTSSTSKNNGRTIAQIEYASAIGYLMYATHCTRPDIAYTVCKLSRYTSNPSQDHWKAMGRVFGYLKRTRQLALYYDRFPAVLEGYSDASWITRSGDSKSTTGWIFTLGGAICWGSKKQTCITHSTIEVEFLALAATGKEAEWLRNMLLDIEL